MKNITINLILLSLLTISFAGKVKPKLYYGISVEYIFDSNVGQNINETNAHYVVPKLDLKLKDFTSIPWFIRANFIYDAYQQKRVPTLNSPFVNLGTGFNLGNGKFSYDPEFSALLYVGMNVHIDGDPAAEMKNFVPVKRSLRFKNDITIESKKNKLEINNYIRRNDLGLTSTGNSEDEWRIEIKPKYVYDVKVLKKDKIKIKEIFAELEYEGNFSDKVSESYNMFGLTAGMEFKLLIMSLDIAGRLAQKNFSTEIEHPQENGVMIKPVNKYAYLISSLNIPIISDLDFEIGGKLRFKGSNNPGYDYDRHSLSAKLKWNSRLGSN